MDVQGAGTDAAVFIQLTGDRDGKELTGPRILLDTHANNFERAKSDTFVLMKHKNLGVLKSAKIGHDNSGLGPGKEISMIARIVRWRMLMRMIWLRLVVKVIHG